MGDIHLCKGSLHELVEFFWRKYKCSGGGNIDPAKVDPRKRARKIFGPAPNFKSCACVIVHWEGSARAS